MEQKATWFIAVLFALVALGTGHKLNAQVREFDSVQVQLVADQYIDAITVEGTVRFIDFEQLKSVSAVPVEAHPLVFRGDGYYVACITLLDEAGIEYPVDLYLFEDKGGLVVTDVTFGEEGREDFRRLARSGAVTRID